MFVVVDNENDVSKSQEKDTIMTKPEGYKNPSLSNKYVNMPEEHKKYYQWYRKQGYKKEADAIASNFSLLEAELKKLKATPEVFKLLEACKKAPKAEGTGKTYIEQIFGTMPEVGKTITIDEYNFGMSKADVMKAFQETGNMPSVVERKLGLGQMIWYCAKAGHIVVQNADKSITYKEFKKS